MKKLLALAAILFFAIILSKAAVKRKSKSLQVQSANQRIETDRHTEIDQANDSLRAYFRIGKTIPAEYRFDPAQYEIRFKSESAYADSIKMFLEQGGISGYPAPRLSALMHDVYVNQRFTDMNERYLFGKLNVYYRNYQTLQYHGTPEAFSVWVLYDDVVVAKVYRQDSCAIKAWKFFAR